MKTTLEVFCEAVGWQGGTIHDAKTHFSTLDMKWRDRVCGKLVDNMKDITDLDTARFFLEKRNEFINVVCAGDGKSWPLWRVKLKEEVQS